MANENGRSDALGAQCKHGSLARSCDLCDLIQENCLLRGALAKGREEQSRMQLLMNSLVALLTIAVFLIWWLG
jgi:hypothetical protein